MAWASDHSPVEGVHLALQVVLALLLRARQALQLRLQLPCALLRVRRLAAHLLDPAHSLQGHCEDTDTNASHGFTILIQA